MKRLASIERALEQLQRMLGADLTMKQIRVFLMISKASIEGDPLTTEDLRRFLNLSSQTAHNTISYFVERGFIARELAVFDGRAKHLQLTSAGRIIVAELADAIANTSAEAFATAFRCNCKTKEPNVNLFQELIHD